MLNSSKYLLKIVGLLLFLGQSFSSFSQDNERVYLIDALLWDRSGDTIQGKINYTNQFSCQFNIALVDTSGKEIALYSPKDISGFKYTVLDEVVEFRSMQNPMDMGRVFMRIVYNGYYTLYQFLELNYQSNVISFLVSYFIWDKDWVQPPITQKYEMESLLYHFSDCPELEYKIKTAEYGLANIREILTQYEACKKTDDYEYFYE